LHTVCQRFCQLSEPCSDPCFILFNGQWRGGGGCGGGVKCERVESIFNQELTPIGPHPNFILFNPLHCYKNSFTLLEITIGQDKNIRLVRTLGVLMLNSCCTIGLAKSFMSKILSYSSPPPCLWRCCCGCMFSRVHQFVGDPDTSEIISTIGKQ
jgi:hypothetical protein